MHNIQDSGDLRVVYGERLWTLNPSAVVKVSIRSLLLYIVYVRMMDIASVQYSDSDHPAAVLLVAQADIPRFAPGDVVRIMDDLAEVAKLQKNHGGWNEEMASVSKLSLKQFTCLLVEHLHGMQCVAGSSPT